ncbi:hypothetical protein C6499_07995 [Candidatus Poribacteria bacterium]|nr:MAG: hypothetical protein C6499_07995 [Candidatus Poribacteria bacterium]
MAIKYHTHAALTGLKKIMKVFYKHGVPTELGRTVPLIFNPEVFSFKKISDFADFLTIRRG